MDAKTQTGRAVHELQQPKLFPGRSQPLILTRFLPAAPARVFALWTEAKHLLHWLPAEGFSVALCESDLQPGGSAEVVLRAADGASFSIKRLFLEVSAEKRLVYNEQCVGSSGVFYAALTTVTFEKLGNKTKLTLRAEPDQHYSVSEQAEWHRGCNELLDRFEQYLAQTT